MEFVKEEEEGGRAMLSAGKADWRMSARLVPVQFSLAAVSLTCVISSVRLEKELTLGCNGPHVNNK